MLLWHAPGRRPGKTRRPFVCRPRLESLEGRWLPSTVTNLNDAGAGSLRQAILDTPTNGTVDFQPGLNGTITLLTGELLLNKDLTITGPGADVLTVSGNQSSRVFVIQAPFTVQIVGLTITQGYISGGTSSPGGGIDNLGTLTLVDCTLKGNVAHGNNRVLAVGGGIANYGTLTVRDSTISSNAATAPSDIGRGGGIYNAGTLALIGSTVSGNQAVSSSFQYSYGSGIDNAGTLAISSSTISENTLGSPGIGGGISNGGTLTSGMLTISNSTVSGNSAGVDGGGIYNNNNGTLTITNSTLSGSSADGVSFADGGGILNNGTLTITNSTLSGSSVPSSGIGGGLYDGGSTPAILGDTIIADNTGPTSSPDVSGPLNSQGHNLIGNSQGGSGYADTDLLNVDPLLGPLQDNGGSTQTMALLPGSPAIDAGDNTNAPMWDQRGAPFRRIVNGTIDIGAFEVQAHAHNPPTGQPLPDPVSVQGLPASPLLGQLPVLAAAPASLPGTGVPAGQTGQPEPGPEREPTAGGQPVDSFFVAAADLGQFSDPLGAVVGP